MKKSILIYSIILAAFSTSTENINLVKADNTQTSEQSTKTNTSLVETSQTNNIKEQTTAPTGVPIFARDSSKGPGYYQINSSSIPFSRELLMRDTSHQAFLNEIKAASINGWVTNGILPSITAAQAIQESGWGKSISGTNNILGIKGTPGTLLWTREVNSSGETYYEQDYFKNFSSVGECIEYHNSLLSGSSIYQGISGQRDYTIAAQDLKYYATDPDYVSDIINIIQEYGLTSWDQEAFNETDFPHTAIDTSTITIQYVPNYGVLAYNDSGNSIGGTNTVFIDGSKWKTAGSAVINGEEMYEVAPNEYIPMKYTTVGADGTVTINYTEGYGVMGFHLDGSSVAGSNLVLKTGTVWKTSGAAMINGEIMYQIATDEYVPKEYTQFGNGQ